jgi:hypothetical protein
MSLMGLALTACLALCRAASAGDDDISAPTLDWRETWIGADASSGSWSIYSGLSVAPLANFDAGGLRLRTSGGYGQYRYRHNEWTGNGLARVEHRGEVAFTDLLLGYQLRLAPLTVTGWAGAAAVARQTTPFDRDDSGQGFTYGPKFAAESWLDIGAASWAAFDLAWTSAQHEYATRVRAGYRLQPALSVGIEGAAFGHTRYHGERAGAFVRYEWGGAEVSVGTGAAGDQVGCLAPYLSINALMRY